MLLSQQPALFEEQVDVLDLTPGGVFVVVVKGIVGGLRGKDRLVISFFLEASPI